MIHIEVFQEINEKVFVFIEKNNFYFPKKMKLLKKIYYYSILLMIDVAEK